MIYNTKSRERCSGGNKKFQNVSVIWFRGKKISVGECSTSQCKAIEYRNGQICLAANHTIGKDLKEQFTQKCPLKARFWGNSVFFTCRFQFHVGVMYKLQIRFTIKTNITKELVCPDYKMCFRGLLFCNETFPGAILSQKLTEGKWWTCLSVCQFSNTVFAVSCLTVFIFFF